MGSEMCIRDRLPGLVVAEYAASVLDCPTFSSADVHFSVQAIQKYHTVSQRPVFYFPFGVKCHALFVHALGKKKPKGPYSSHAFDVLSEFAFCILSEGRIGFVNDAWLQT